MGKRLALVTGAASGIGFAVARALADANWEIALADRDSRVVDIAKELGGVGTILDVCDTRAVDDWVNSAPGAEGLVTSAGVWAGAPLIASTDEDWISVLDINLMGTMRALRAFARRRIADGGGGAAVLIASNNAFWPCRGISQYCASKAAVLMLGRTAASELGERQIRVNVVAPGATDTPMTRGVFDREAKAAEVVRRTPLARIGQPDDIASAIRFLLSPEAAWITGQLLSVDGGISLRGESTISTYRGNDSPAAG